MSAVDRNLLEAWLAHQHSEQGSPEYELLFWSFEQVSDLCYESPDQAWAFILAAWAADQTQAISELLSAGPLEDLLSHHGPYVIDRVESEARQNPSFAFLLGGVWQNAMSAEIWSRVQAAQNRRGWDGNPGTQPGIRPDVPASDRSAG